MFEYSNRNIIGTIKMLHNYDKYGVRNRFIGTIEMLHNNHTYKIN